MQEAAERAFLAGEEPIDRAVLIPLLVVGIEILLQVIVDWFAQCLLDEVEVSSEHVITKDYADKLLDAVA